MKNETIKKSSLSIFISLLLTAVCALMSLTVGVRAYSAHAAASATEEEDGDIVPSEEVFSYRTIFKVYYEKAEQIANDEGVEICSFEEFCDNYYNYDFDIKDYTEAVAYGYDLDELAGIELYSSGSGSSSQDAAYILSPDDYDITPSSAFKREPCYTEEYDYSLIKDGDIVYETLYPPEIDPFLKTGHCGLVYNTNKDSDYGKYIQTIDAVGSGVNFAMLDDTRIIRWKAIILRVEGADPEKVDEVKEFCYAQLGKEYDWTAPLDSDINGEKWYCSQLLYAAYNSVGINIRVRKNGSGNDVNPGSPLTPKDIYRSYNTYEIRLNFKYLGLEVVGKTGGNWEIRITNNNDFDVTAEYNSKMCFKDAAIFWTTQLKDIENITIGANDYVDVSIHTNLFADFITVSYMNDENRYVSYGNNLDKKTSTLTVRYNTVKGEVGEE